MPGYLDAWPVAKFSPVCIKIRMRNITTYVHARLPPSFILILDTIF